MDTAGANWIVVVAMVSLQANGVQGDSTVGRLVGGGRFKYDLFSIAQIVVLVASIQSQRHVHGEDERRRRQMGNLGGCAQSLEIARAAIRLVGAAVTAA